jgi:hypothetical protein
MPEMADNRSIARARAALMRTTVGQDAGTRRRLLTIALIVAAQLLGAALAPPPAVAKTGEATRRSPQAAPAGNRESAGILRLIGVGQVLTTDGRVLSYDPQRRAWQDIDAAFRAQGKTTRVLPLPVAVDEIREMVTFGFLVTEAGACWVYDLQEDRWEKTPPLPDPPSGRGER